jgi:hypothetical protein
LPRNCVNTPTDAWCIEMVTVAILLRGYEVGIGP